MNVPRPEQQRTTKNSKRRFRLAVLAILSILLASTAKSADTGLSPSAPRKFEAVERATAWLIDQQHKDGSWPGRGMANTALATLSVADGAGPFWCGEPFLDSVRRGRQAMLKRLNSDLDVCFQSDPIGFSVAVYALAATPPFEGEEAPCRCLGKAVETICRWQGDDGTWRFDSEVADVRSDAFLTAWAVLALESGFRGGISPERCKRALDRFARAWSDLPQPIGGPDFSDADVLRSGLSAHARDLISGTQDKSLSEFTEFIFDSNGGPSKGDSLFPFGFQLPFLLRAMAASYSAKEFKSLSARTGQLAKRQISDSDTASDGTNEQRRLGHWISPVNDEFRLASNPRFSPQENSRVEGEGENVASQIQDTCFCILQFAQEAQVRLLPNLPRIRIPEERAPELAAPGPVHRNSETGGKHRNIIKRRW